MSLGFGFALPSAARSSAAGGAYRYWRLTGFAIADVFFEISEVQFFSGGSRVNVVMTSSVVPSVGPLGNLNDQNLTTSCYWNTTDVPNFANLRIIGDCTTPIAINAIRLGGFDNSGRYPSALSVEYSPDNINWTQKAAVSGLSYPGNFTLSASIPV